MSTESDIRGALRQWVAGVSGKTCVEDLADDTPPFRHGMLKSVHINDLILYIEELARRAVGVEQIKPGGVS